MTVNPFEGADVLSAGIEIRNAAGGLNQALGVDPQEWHRDDEVTVVLRCRVDKVRFDPIKDTRSLRRVHIMSATQATVVDGKLDGIDELLDEQARKIEEAQGIVRLPFTGGPTDDMDEVERDLLDAHARGLHRVHVPDCPECEAEARAHATGD